MRARTVLIAASLAGTLTACTGGPDHSPEDASAETRALWESARTGNVGEVTRLLQEGCADPFVRFPTESGLELTAREIAEARAAGTIGPALSPQERISIGLTVEAIRQAEAVWRDRCA